MLSQWRKTFRNVTEYHEPTILTVKSGAVPKTLQGTYYKCGPGVFHEYGCTVVHPFDGDGVVTAFQFKEGRITYQSRIVDTQHRQHEQRLGRRVYSGAFGTPPKMRPLKNTANTNVIRWGDKLLVFCESGAPYVLNAQTLETIGPLNPFQDGTPMKTSMPQLDAWLRRMRIFGDVVGAHPKIDKVDEDEDEFLVFYTLTYAQTSTVITFFEIDKNLQICMQTPYSVNGFLYLHDFVVTPTHYVFFQHALELNMGNAHMGIVHCLESKPELGTAHAVARCTRGTSHTAHIMPGFVTHHTGRDSSGGDCGLCVFSVMYPELIKFNDMANSKNCLVKTTWDFLEAPIQEVVYDGTDSIIEFPTNMFAILGASCLAQLALGKVVSSWDAGPTAFIGEPVLDGAGHVMTVIHDVEKTSSVLAIFEENKLEHGPIAEVWLPEHVPITLHGSWSS